jgi:hypothetical protein
MDSSAAPVEAGFDARHSGLHNGIAGGEQEGGQVTSSKIHSLLPVGWQGVAVGHRWSADAFG